MGAQNLQPSSPKCIFYISEANVCHLFSENEILCERGIEQKTIINNSTMTNKSPGIEDGVDVTCLLGVTDGRG